MRIDTPSVPVLGELLYGALHSGRRGEGLREIIQFVERITVIPCTNETACRYALLKSELADKGRLLTENDLWIAATALEYGFTLITHDNDFDVVPNLAKDRW